MSTRSHPQQTQPMGNLPKAATNQGDSRKAPSSWADKVKVTNANTRYSLDPMPRLPMGQQLIIPEDVMEGVDQWMRCLVDFFPGSKMPYHAINNMGMRVWRTKGLESVTTTANGFILFRFKSQENLQGVLEQGPWLFGGKHLILQQWNPRFQFDASQIKTLPVWIRLRGLPLPLWTTKGLSLVDSMVGKPLSCDEATHRCSRLEYARICVEIDAEMAYVHKFEVVTPLSLQPITIHVDYEWKPARCNTCKVFGHSCGETVEKARLATMLAADKTPTQAMQNLGHNEEADANKKPESKDETRPDKGKQIAHVTTSIEPGGTEVDKTDMPRSKSVGQNGKMTKNLIYVDIRTDTFPCQASTNEGTGESSYANTEDSPSASLKTAKKKKGGKNKKAENRQ
ncbi:hypothetical protein OIU84_027449 [Salix udensis]|uniref:DUF4283 domain-containing protein n=1 Tax=Salix udensis TaxID=889485 RepID=A0AAD6PAF1_9ROSI|nr:hypothetical protein OIU84_027449 [Salix udensis]